MHTGKKAEKKAEKKTGKKAEKVLKKVEKEAPAPPQEEEEEEEEVNREHSSPLEEDDADGEEGPLVEEAPAPPAKKQKKETKYVTKADLDDFKRQLQEVLFSHLILLNSTHPLRLCWRRSTPAKINNRNSQPLLPLNPPPPTPNRPFASSLALNSEVRRNGLNFSAQCLSKLAWLTSSNCPRSPSRALCALVESGFQPAPPFATAVVVPSLIHSFAINDIDILRPHIKFPYRPYQSAEEKWGNKKTARRIYIALLRPSRKRVNLLICK